MFELVRQHLERAKLRMKRQADKGRSERTFVVGDWVYLKLQPYVQASVALRSHQKLSFKFFGPFQITQKVGEVAYKLKLPDSAKIHPVVHVSQLKRALGSDCVASPVLPTDSYQFSVPSKIIQRRTVTQGMSPCSQVLVQWSHMPLALATWEDEQALQQQFPYAAVWGQPASLAGGDVSTGGPLEEVVDGHSTEASRPRRSVRPTRRNVRVHGPDWINEIEME